jgi:hypothetical protein
MKFYYFTKKKYWLQFICQLAFQFVNSLEIIPQIYYIPFLLWLDIWIEKKPYLLFAQYAILTWI